MPKRFSTNSLHTSVLLKESAQSLCIADTKNCHRFIDATLGMGGHTKYFLNINPSLFTIGFDQDPFARKEAQENLKEYNNRFKIIPQNFETIGNQKEFSPNAILFDIGVSSLQFDTPERGFSFRFSAPLDMRMNPENILTAKIIINTWNEEKLEQIFREYGEESWSKKIAEEICKKRKITPFTTTNQLSDFITTIKPFSKKRNGKNQGGHPATLIFQSLRIAVNAELEVLKKALHGAINILAPNGRLAVISFHSLEDRIVKNIFNSYCKKEKKQKYPHIVSSSNDSTELILQKISKKPIIPTLEEINTNPRARSAKMRIIQKISSL